MVCGNPSRLNAFGLRPPSTKWKSELSRELLENFERIAGKLNKKFGYL